MKENGGPGSGPRIIGPDNIRSRALMSLTVAPQLSEIDLEIVAAGGLLSPSALNEPIKMSREHIGTSASLWGGIRRQVEYGLGFP